MRIETKDFGAIEIEPEHIIHFSQGIVAFEDVQDYVLLNYDFAEDNSPIKCLQSVDGKVSFTVVDPFCFLADYQPVLTDADKKSLAVTDQAQLRFLVMAVVGKDFHDTVVNLRSPIAINPANRQALQLILDDTHYPLRYQLFAEQEDVK